MSSAKETAMVNRQLTAILLQTSVQDSPAVSHANLKDYAIPTPEISFCKPAYEIALPRNTKLARFLKDEIT